MIPVLVNLDRASIKQDEEGPFYRGVECGEWAVFSVLESLGVTVLKPWGSPYDPAVHEAVCNVEAGEDIEDGFVTDEIQAGYRFRQSDQGGTVKVAGQVLMVWSRSTGKIFKFCGGCYFLGKGLRDRLGTTNSCVAVKEGDHITVITNGRGARTTPRGGLLQTRKGCRQLATRRYRKT